MNINRALLEAGGVKRHFMTAEERQVKKKLCKLLIDKKMNRTELKDSSGISFNVLAKMGKNEFVSMESLMKICATLNCNVGDIMDFLPESEGLQE